MSKSDSANPRSQLSLMMFRLLLRGGVTRKTNSSAGVTLLEALVAIILITVIVSVITPPIFLAVATRVNNRRTEQAMQLAQGEIERVRLLMTSSQSEDAIKNFLPKAVTLANPDAIYTVPAPTTLCNDAPPCEANQLADAEPQLPDTAPQRFYIQSFRDQGAVINDDTGDPDDDELFAFRMGVRVYGGQAVDNLGNLKKDPRGTLFTTGTGARGYAPMVVLYTELNRGSTRGGLVKLKNYAE